MILSTSAVVSYRPLLRLSASPILVAYCTRLSYKALQDALTYLRRLSHPPVEDAQANSLLCVIAFAVSDIAPSNPLSVCRCSTITFDSHAMLYSHVFMCSENH